MILSTKICWDSPSTPPRSVSSTISSISKTKAVAVISSPLTSTGPCVAEEIALLSRTKDRVVLAMLSLQLKPLNAWHPSVGPKLLALLSLLFRSPSSNQLTAQQVLQQTLQSLAQTMATKDATVAGWPTCGTLRKHGESCLKARIPTQPHMQTILASMTRPKLSWNRPVMEALQPQMRSLDSRAVLYLLHWPPVMTYSDSTSPEFWPQLTAAQPLMITVSCLLVTAFRTSHRLIMVSSRRLNGGPQQRRLLSRNASI